jgi:hypothetical protein
LRLERIDRAGGDTAHRWQRSGGWLRCHGSGKPVIVRSTIEFLVQFLSRGWFGATGSRRWR